MQSTETPAKPNTPPKRASEEESVKRPIRLRSPIAKAIILAAILLLIVLAGLAFGEQAIATDFTRKALPPRPDAIFGTDWMGRDLFARTMKGLSTSILIGLFAASVSAIIAVILGSMAALGPRWLDHLVGWLIDLVLGIPHILLLILISVAMGRGFWGVAIGVAVTHWPSLARVIRAEILQAREATYIAVAKKLGRSRLQIAVDHMIPLIAPQFLVGLVLLFPHAILHEASITFLGFGLSPEQPAVGVILSESMGYLTAGMWWSALFPGLCLILVVIIFDQLGKTLQWLLADRSASNV